MMRAIGLTPFTARRRRVGWESNSVFQVLIVTGTKAGVFVYSPSPGPNKLVASVAAVGSTDAFGNTYLSGFVSYVNSGGNFFAVQTSAGQIGWFSGGPTEVGAPWVQTSQISGVGNPDLTLASNRNIVAQQLLTAIGGLQVTASGADQVALSNALAGGLL